MQILLTEVININYIHIIYVLEERDGGSDHITRGIQVAYREVMAEPTAFTEFVMQGNIHTQVEKGKIRKGTNRHQ